MTMHSDNNTAIDAQIGGKHMRRQGNHSEMQSQESSQRADDSEGRMERVTPADADAVLYIEWTRKQTNQSPSVLLEDLEDDNDIPPWHKSNTEKPAWLQKMLAQAAEKEDASHVYKRYRSKSKRPAKTETARIKDRS